MTKKIKIWFDRNKVKNKPKVNKRIKIWFDRDGKSKDKPKVNKQIKVWFDRDGKSKDKPKVNKQIKVWFDRDGKAAEKPKVNKIKVWFNESNKIADKEGLDNKTKNAEYWIWRKKLQDAYILIMRLNRLHDFSKVLRIDNRNLVNNPNVWKRIDIDGKTGSTAYSVSESPIAPNMTDHTLRTTHWNKVKRLIAQDIINSLLGSVNVLKAATHRHEIQKASKELEIAGRKIFDNDMLDKINNLNDLNKLCAALYVNVLKVKGISYPLNYGGRISLRTFIEYDYEIFMKKEFIKKENIEEKVINPTKILSDLEKYWSKMWFILWNRNYNKTGIKKWR